MDRQNANKKEEEWGTEREIEKLKDSGERQQVWKKRELRGEKTRGYSELWCTNSCGMLLSVSTIMTNWCVSWIHNSVWCTCASSELIFRGNRDGVPLARQPVRQLTLIVVQKLTLKVIVHPTLFFSIIYILLIVFMNIYFLKRSYLQLIFSFNFFFFSFNQNIYFSSISSIIFFNYSILFF